MSQLIPILHNGGKQSVDAKELHRFLEVSSRLRDWIRNRIQDFDFSEGVDYQTAKILATGEISYLLSLDMAKELSMVERSEKGKEARRYFIACENRLREVTTHHRLPATYGEAMMEAGRLAIKAEELESLTVQQRELKYSHG